MVIAARRIPALGRLLLAVNFSMAPWGTKALYMGRATVRYSD